MTLPLKPKLDDDIVQPTSPTFKIFTGALKAYEKPDDSRKYLRCTASSTVEDLHGDRMTDECVMGMAPQAKSKGMTIFLNHSYKMPEDVFGKTVDASIISRSQDSDGKAVYDLDLEIQLNEANPRAVETYSSIKEQGIKAGVSIGAMIEDWDYVDEDEGFWGGLIINQVNLLEASIVGIPANQRSWVINGITALGAPKAMIQKALGKDVERPGKPPEPDALVAEVINVDAKYFLAGKDVTAELDVIRTESKGIPNADGSYTLNGTTFKSIVVKDLAGNTITNDSTAPEDEETPAEENKSADEPDPADDEKSGASLIDAENALDTLKAAGADTGLLDIVLGFLEGATDEVVSLRKALAEVTEERDQAVSDVKDAAEIVETLARTPLGRKAQFMGPVNDFRHKYGGLYDEDFLKVLEGAQTDA